MCSQAATHWSQQLTWRTFFAAMCSCAFLNLLLSAFDFAVPGVPFGQLAHPGLLTFGSFADCQEMVRASRSRHSDTSPLEPATAARD